VYCVCVCVCKCVLYYCHWVSTQLQLTNISISLCYSSSHRTCLSASSDDTDKHTCAHTHAHTQTHTHTYTARAHTRARARAHTHTHTHTQTHMHVDTYFSSKCFPQDHHFVQDAAQCPDVSSLVMWLTFTQFWCQVARSSKHGRRLCLPAACDNSYYCITVLCGNEIPLFGISVKEGVVGRVCSTHGRVKRCVQGFCGET
jgi:hypothetical protein